jgi:subtilisin family serine protease
VIPNGERVPLSGTSMASPNVANLAAKMYALDPALTPARAIEIIVETGAPIAAPFTGRIAHEEHALARVRAERHGAEQPAGASRPAPSGSAHPAAGRPNVPGRPRPGSSRGAPTPPPPR